jgi:putative membrane protein
MAQNTARPPYLVRLTFSALLMLVLAKVLPGVSIDPWWQALLAALLISVLNATVRPLLILFTLPITLFSFGLFLFIINALVISLAARWISGFQIESFGYALLFSLAISLVNSLVFQKKREDFQN